MFLRPLSRVGGVIFKRSFSPFRELTPTTAVAGRQTSGQVFDEIDQLGGPFRLFLHCSDPGGAVLFLAGAQFGALFRLSDTAAQSVSPLVHAADDARLAGKRLPVQQFRRGDGSARPVAHRGFRQPLHQMAPAKVVLDDSNQAQQQPAGGGVLQRGWLRSGHRQAGQTEFQAQLVSVRVGLPVERGHAVERRALPGLPQNVPDCAADFLSYVGRGNDAVHQETPAGLVAGACPGKTLIPVLGSSRSVRRSRCERFGQSQRRAVNLSIASESQDQAALTVAGQGAG